MRAQLASIFGMIGAMSMTAQAVAWALASSITFQALSTLMKMLGASLPPLEIAFVRGAAALVLVAVTWQALRDLRSLPDPNIHLLRAGLGTVALLCSVYALSTKLPLALVSIILYSRILMMIPLARVTLGERAGPALWAATLIGFGGVVLAVSPSLTLPDQLLGVAAMIAAAVTSAGSQLAVRRLTLTTPSSVIVAAYAALSTLLLVVPAAWVWVTPTLAEAGGLLGIGLFGMAALYCTAQAYRFAPATIVAPLSFIEIPLAAALDYSLWGSRRHGRRWLAPL
ncbi:DMT family transporter [Azospirillum doebereinerae]|uniref:DMT family transporter n=1 Tax=Azospirillum doebereinerae TaxID=92933 RepID=A0A433J190_9PROT|nr:DMT family transporter [Azospirillum doebereinerae]RUQ63972.1 DMT family transporter [Azospirillum doebereinerae]